MRSAQDSAGTAAADSELILYGLFVHEVVLKRQQLQAVMHTRFKQQCQLHLQLESLSPVALLDNTAPAAYHSVSKTQLRLSVTAGVPLLLIQTVIHTNRQLTSCSCSSSSSPAGDQGNRVLFVATHLHSSINRSLDQNPESRKLAKFSGIRLRLSFRWPFGEDWCDRD